MASQAAIALYKGPPKSRVSLIGHYAIRIWTLDKYSHAELVIDGMCYSSSARDGGVRAKKIDLGSGHWDVYPIQLSAVKRREALQWFEANQSAGYDWLNVIRWVLPFVPHGKRQYVCYEAVAAMLGLAGAHRLSGKDLKKWAVQWTSKPF